MAEYNTRQRVREITRVTEILETTYRIFRMDIEVTGVDYGPRTGLLHCHAQDLDDTEKVRRIIVNLEYALAKSPISISISQTEENSFDVTVPFDDEVSLPEWKDATPLPEPHLSIPLGVTVSGQELNLDLDVAQHILIAGQTASGKSTVIHALICSLMRTSNSQTLAFVLMDPKRVDLTLYKEDEQLYVPVVTDSEQATQVFTQLKEEMDRRLKMSPQDLARLPKLIVIVDEFSDFMCSQYATSIEQNVLALTATGHTVGIHVILSTSRPSTDIFTDKIRAAFPSRIVGVVVSSVDSLTMLETRGAERLLGMGDMILRTSDQKELIRFQALHISADDIINHRT